MNPIVPVFGGRSLTERIALHQIDPPSGIARESGVVLTLALASAT
jgi:hypothetical protein